MCCYLKGAAGDLKLSWGAVAQLVGLWGNRSRYPCLLHFFVLIAQAYLFVVAEYYYCYIVALAD